MFINLKRIYTSKSGGTISAVSIDGHPLYYNETAGIPIFALEPYDYFFRVPIKPTAEDYKRAKKAAVEEGISAICIPEGLYQVIINHSKKFGKDLPLLLNVPAFEGIRIHSFNWACQSKGCIGFGLFYEKYITYSKTACSVVHNKINQAIKQGDKVFIEIKSSY